MTCSHDPVHVAANWTIQNEEEGILDRFLTREEAEEALPDFVGGFHVVFNEDPDPCGDKGILCAFSTYLDDGWVVCCHQAKYFLDKTPLCWAHGWYHGNKLNQIKGDQ